MNSPRDTDKFTYKFNEAELEKVEKVDMKNLDLILKQTIVRFEKVREDKKSNQGKAQFVLAIVGAAIALLIAELVSTDRSYWVIKTYVGIEAVVLCFIGSFLVSRCLLPSSWTLEGLTVSDAWEIEKARSFTPKAFKIFVAKSYEDRIRENIDANEQAVDSLINLTLATFLSPILVALLVFVIWCLSNLCFS